MMHLKNFFTRLCVSLIYLALGLSILVIGIVVMGRISVYRAQSSQLPPSACYVAGRSGGHLIPAMTLAQKQQAAHPDTRILVFTAATQLDLFVMKKYPWITHHESLMLDNRPRGITLSWLPYLWHFARTTARAFTLLRHYGPLSVTTTGGYIAVPVCLAARALGIPIYLYNLDVESGSAIAFLSSFATRVIVCFEETKKLLSSSASVEVGAYPLRFNTTDIIHKHEARKRLNITGLTENSRVLLVIGGSQGSHFINDLIPATVAPWTDKKSLFVLHQTGDGEVQRVRELYATHNIPALVFPYRDDMPVLYQAADLVVTRAGAGSLFELVFFRVPAIVIPLETATTAHQLANAAAIARRYPELFTVYLQNGGGDFSALIRGRI